MIEGGGVKVRSLARGLTMRCVRGSANKAVKGRGRGRRERSVDESRRVEWRETEEARRVSDVGGANYGIYM